LELDALSWISLGIIAVSNPEYVSKLWDRPNLLWALLGSELVGLAWIRRIISLDY
jgi:Flp pilus assembly protein TadB